MPPTRLRSASRDRRPCAQRTCRRRRGRPIPRPDWRKPNQPHAAAPITTVRPAEPDPRAGRPPTVTVIQTMPAVLAAHRAPDVDAQARQNRWRCDIRPRSRVSGPAQSWRTPQAQSPSEPHARERAAPPPAAPAGDMPHEPKRGEEDAHLSNRLATARTLSPDNAPVAPNGLVSLPIIAVHRVRGLTQDRYGAVSLTDWLELSPRSHRPKPTALIRRVARVVRSRRRRHSTRPG